MSSTRELSKTEDKIKNFLCNSEVSDISFTKDLVCVTLSFDNIDKKLYIPLTEFEGLIDILPESKYRRVKIKNEIILTMMKVIVGRILGYDDLNILAKESGFYKSSVNDKAEYMFMILQHLDEIFDLERKKDSQIINSKLYLSLYKLVMDMFDE